jgi:serine/threonine-protein kinase
MAVMIHHARTAPQPPSKLSGHPLPERLEEIVMSCLEKAPEKRPASAVELWRELGEVPFATPWTSERADSWWREYLPDLARPSTAGDSSSELIVVPVD